MAAIESVTLEVPDPTAAEAFYKAAFGLGDTVKVQASEEPTTGFRGFTLSLVVSPPSPLDSHIGTPHDAGAQQADGLLQRRQPQHGQHSGK